MNRIWEVSEEATVNFRSDHHLSYEMYEKPNANNSCGVFISTNQSILTMFYCTIFTVGQTQYYMEIHFGRLFCFAQPK